MRQDNITRQVAAPFDELLQKAVKLITANGFLLIQQIDPQAILAQHGMVAAKVRQLLFFHPSYMRQILSTAPEAVIEAPLKLVLRDTGDGGTSISYFDPLIHFSGYVLPEGMSRELQQKQEHILDQLLA
jgi:uncharacterized protein (DUF302 family)